MTPPDAKVIGEWCAAVVIFALCLGAALIVIALCARFAWWIVG